MHCVTLSQGAGVREVEVLKGHEGSTVMTGDLTLKLSPHLHRTHRGWETILTTKHLKNINQWVHILFSRDIILMTQ